MKNFIVSILCISVFFIGVGTIVEKAGATLKSDEKALEIVRSARAAIGGETAISNVRGLAITGRAAHTFKMDGVQRTEQGEAEIAMQLPDKFMRIVKLGAMTNGAGPIVENEVVTTRGDDKIVLRTDGKPGGEKFKRVIVRDGESRPGEEITSDDGKNVFVHKIRGHGDDVKAGGAAGEQKHLVIRKADTGEGYGMRRSELVRTALSLLMTAPAGTDVSYRFVGEESVDGTSCNVIEALTSGTSLALYLSRDSNLPVMISYMATEHPRVIRLDHPEKEGTLRTKDTLIMSAKMDAAQMVAVQVKFSDYRSTGGLMLPHRWMKTVNGEVSETLDVTSYEINPENLADRFQFRKELVEMKSKNDN